MPLLALTDELENTQKMPVVGLRPKLGNPLLMGTPEFFLLKIMKKSAESQHFFNRVIFFKASRSFSLTFSTMWRYIFIVIRLFSWPSLRLI